MSPLIAAIVAAEGIEPSDEELLAALEQSVAPDESGRVADPGSRDVVELAAPVGDLFESFIKREAAVKDSGGLFGPHGGALDRLDAVLFAAVVGFYIWAAYL